MIFFASKEKTEDLLYQAMSFMEKKQPKNAIPFFKKVIKQEPKNIEALYNHGLALNQLKNIKMQLHASIRYLRLTQNILQLSIIVVSHWQN